MLKRPRLSDEDVQLSFRKILRLPEAMPALAALHAIVDEIGPSETCALHAHNERRRFASELLAMVAAKAEDGGEGDGSENDDRQDGRVFRRQGKGRNRSRRHGPAGER